MVVASTAVFLLTDPAPSGAQVPITVTPAANPPLPAKCGLDVALVFDLSNSVTATQFDEMRQAGIDLAGDLRGTPSSIGVYTFASFAPAYNTSPTSGTPAANGPLPAVSLSTDAGVTQVQNRIRNLTRVTTTFGGTNWDQGLRQVIAAGQPHYDAVLFVTDGSPTFYGAGSSPQGPGNSTTTAVIDAAVTAANLVKARQTRVVAVGVSDTVGAELAYLRAISGPTANSDYFVTNFAHLRETLIGAAAEHCFGSVTVVKEVQGLDGTRTPAADWVFSASAGAGASVTPASGVTGSDGALNFVASSPTSATTVTLSETLKPGFRLLQQDGRNAVCSWNVGVPAESAVTNDGTTGFSVPITDSDIVSCTVVNAVVGASLTLEKVVHNIPGSGSATPDDWLLHATGPSSVTTRSGRATPVLPGTYTLSESGGPPGPPASPDYTASSWVCSGTGVDQTSGTQVTLAEDAVASCTVTNTEVPVVRLVQNKTVDALVAEHGDTLTYTMTVENVGTGPAGPFTAIDTLPEGVAFVDAVPSVGTFDSATGEWTIPALAVDETATLRITVTVTASPAAGESESLTNRFKVTAPEGSEPTEVEHPCSDDTTESCADTEVFGPEPAPALVQTKSVDRTTAAPGDTLTYTVEVLNIGNTAAGAFTATDTLPSGVTFVAATPSTGTAVHTGGVVTWDIPSLAVGALATLTIEVTVDTTGTEATTQTNRFQVTTPPPGFAAPEVENRCPDDEAESCASTEIPGVPRLTQSKTVDRSTAAAGDELVYTMTVENTGTGTADDVVAHDAAPARVTFVSASPSQGSFDHATGIWEVGTLEPGTKATLTVVVTVEPEAEGTTVVDRFNVEAPPGGEDVTVENPCPEPDETESCASTVVPGVVRLTQSKVVSAFEAKVGDTLVYTVQVGNELGTGTAEDVTATDTLPAGVTFVSAAASQGIFNPATGVWTIGAIRPGQTVMLTIVVTVDAGTENTSQVNRFVVDEPNGPLAEPENPCADQEGASCATTDVLGVPRLTQGKTVSTTTAAVGDTLTYTITVANHGTGDATIYTAHDLLPAGVALLSVDTNGLGTFDKPSGVWTIPLLRPGVTATLNLVVRVLPSAAGQTLTNRLAVTAPPGSGSTVVENPCPDDPSRSCASTVVTAPGAPPPTLPFTGPRQSVPRLLELSGGLMLGGFFLIAAARPRRRGPRLPATDG